MVSFTLQHLYLRDMSHSHPMEGRLGGPQRQFESCGKRKISYRCQESKNDPSVVTPFELSDLL
jgi:hypothetical protein